MERNRMKRPFALILSLFIMLSFIPITVFAADDIVNITTADDLMNVLKCSNASETQGKIYSLDADISIDTNLLREGLAENDIRIFAGSLEGNGHTVTVESNNAAGPLFEQLRGGISNLNIVFNVDVVGTPLAYDISYMNKDDAVTLNNLSVTVNGNILYGQHDYSKYYGSILQPPYNYGNWYIHYGGQPVYLATGFAWYLWGVSVSDVTVNVTGNIGQDNLVDDDATSTGFAYFAAQGDNTNAVKHENITINVGKNILANTGDGHASAYGFATGNTDSTAGFGCNTLEEVSNIAINAQNITASSQKGSSSAMGFARFMQGFTHDCNVNVTGTISAVNTEGDEEEDQYAYTNGDAYAYGFMLNTGGWSIESRRNFVNNQVNVGGIYAKTNSEQYAGTAYASGFAHQMSNTANSVPDLSYNNNKVTITNGDIKAEANKGGAVASGFVTSSGRDYYDRPDHIYENSVYVNGSIIATSQQAEATATGYSYKSSTHRRNCSVTVEKDIVAQSPVQAISAGFNGLQNIDQYYFINQSTVIVRGNIQAVQTGEQKGIAVAGGLNAVIMQPSGGPASTKVKFNGNRVEVYGDILAEHNANSAGYTGLMIALSEHSDPAKGTIELNDNLFVGQESLIEIAETDQETYPDSYTNFTGVSEQTIYQSATGNRVIFLRDGECPYSADVTLLENSDISAYGDLWKLSNQKTEHTIKKVEAKAATCTEDGNIEYWYCSVCGKYFADEALTEEITQEDTIIKALGHNFDDMWSADHDSHWHKCTICGAETDKSAHSFKWVIDKEATKTEKGFKHEECSVCGYKKSQIEIPATGTPTDPTGPDDGTNSPGTGGSSDMILWIALLFVSGAGLFGAMVYSRKRKYNR